MVYRFKLVSDEVNNFSRTIQADSESTFGALRDCLLKSVGYDAQGWCAFYLCDKSWERSQQIACEDTVSASDIDVYLMDDTPLEELLEEEGSRLMFCFDPTNGDRAFFMELVNAEPSDYLDEPECVKSVGEPPLRELPVEEEPVEEKIIKLPTDGGDPDFGDEPDGLDDDLDDDDDEDVEDDEEEKDEFYGDSEFDDDELPEGFDVEG